MGDDMVTRRNFGRVLGLILLSVVSLAVRAEPPYEGQATSFFDLDVAGSDKRVRTNIEVKWKVWMLMGEAVEVAHVRWSLDDTTYLPLPEDARGGMVQVGKLPADVRRRIALYDTVVAIPGKRDNATYYFLIDPGIPARAGDDWSFTIPDSPAWDRLYFRLKTFGRGSASLHPRDEFESVAEPRARDLFKTGLDHRTGWGTPDLLMVSGKLDLSAVWTWWAKTRSPENLEAYSEAIDKQIDTLRDVLGLDTSRIEARVGDARRKLGTVDSAEGAEALKTIAARLNAGVPARFGIPAGARTGTLIKDWTSINEIYRRERERVAARMTSELRSDGAEFDSPAKAWEVARRREFDQRETRVALKPSCDGWRYRTGNNCGYVDEMTGEMVIARRFQWAEAFNGKTARVVLNSSIRREDTSECGVWYDVGWEDAALIDVHGNIVKHLPRKDIRERKWTLCLHAQ